MAAQTGFLRCGDITRLSCRLTTQPSAAARASVTCPAKAEDGRGDSGSVGRSGTQLDFMGHDPKVRRPDQAHSEATDARRTECGFHAASKGELAGQRLFQWVGMDGL